MGVKRYWINHGEYLIQLVKRLAEQALLTVQSQGTETETKKISIEAEEIMWRPESSLLFFKIGKDRFKFRVSHPVDSHDNAFHLYLFGSNRLLCIERKQKQPKVAAARLTTFTDSLQSPLTGIVSKILVSPGQRVLPGEPLLVVESMKMENELRSDQEAFVKTIPIRETDLIESGQVVMTFASVGEGHAATQNANGQKEVQNW